MIFIFAQRGATSWGFSIGRVYIYINYPRFWKTSGLTSGFHIENDEEVS